MDGNPSAAQFIPAYGSVSFIGEDDFADVKRACRCGVGSRLSANTSQLISRAFLRFTIEN